MATKITSRVLADDAIVRASLGDDAIGVAEIADDAVTTAAIADDVALGGNPTTTTQSTANSSTRIATTAFVQAAIDTDISALIDSAPGTLNTLNEIAAALNDDPSFTTTVNNAIALKAPIANPVFTGNATFDSPTLYVDGSNNRVGIGTTSPDYQLHISGGGDLLVEDTGNGSAHIRLRSSNSGTATSNWKLKTSSNNYFYIDNDTGSAGTAIAIDNTGKVGIGTASPADRLHVALDSGTTNDTVDVVRIEATSSGTPAVGLGPVIDFRADRVNGGPDSVGRIGFVADTMTSTTVNGAYVVETAIDGTYSERMRIDSSGKVGIGTTSPSYVLHTKSSGSINTWLQSTHATDCKLQFSSATTDDYSRISAIAGVLKYEADIASASSSSGHQWLIDGAEKLRISTSGQIGIGGANYGSDGQVLTSTGASSAPAWESLPASTIDALSDAKSGGTNFGSSLMIGTQTTGTLSNATAKT